MDAKRTDRPRRGSRGPVLVAAAALVALVTGCAGDDQPDSAAESQTVRGGDDRDPAGPDEDPTEGDDEAAGASDVLVSPGNASVVVVGDSVTHLSAAELRSEFEWASELEIRATSGDRTDQLLSEARRGIDGSTDIGIFLPGYNDVLQHTVDTDALPTMIDLAAELPCSVWFLLPRAIPLNRNQATRWNARVEELAAEHPQVHVSNDWKALVERTPSFTFVKEVDGVHPNREGQAALATVMSRAARRHCTEEA